MDTQPKLQASIDKHPNSEEERLPADIDSPKQTSLRSVEILRASWTDRTSQEYPTLEQEGSDTESCADCEGIESDETQKRPHSLFSSPYGRLNRTVLEAARGA